MAAASSSSASFSFKPWNVGRWVVWGGYALLLVVAPLLFTSGLALSMLSQIGIVAIACLAYNMLLGQGGMLSFGHAVYSGLGAYLTMHTLNLMSAGTSCRCPSACCRWSAAPRGCSSRRCSVLSRPASRARRSR